MLSTLALCVLTLAGAAATQNTATSAAAVHAAKATALTSSPTSNVKGLSFDRFVVIMLENTDYSLAKTDPSMAALAKEGISLTNYFGVTHPSEPNYVAAVAGDNFGMDNDNFNVIGNNVSSAIDLLEDKGVSWGCYQQKMPYSGFQGYSWVNQKTGANGYVRKHNPCVIMGANNNKQRLSQMKNLTVFTTDMAANKLPQWMFITPNMTNDGHDTSITTAGAWAKMWYDEVKVSKHFMNNTLVLLTFDETETYSNPNNVYSILLGDAVPKALQGTSDSNYYDHYSQISTIEANWGLHTLGRWDVGANVFANVASKTGDKIRAWTHPGQYMNGSYAGPFSVVNASVPYPVPNVNAVWNGRTVLPSIKSTWGAAALQKGVNMIYNTGVAIPDGAHPPKGYVYSDDY